ncbi:hypothetical protein OG689_44415 [Kitasatospora sp. NBC_00240]|uniref:DUF2637 domain-containing protein n=1 Tax=Kitasatospora sp. NBC_00240 TaxID=2903567 RepID=UPI002254268C|nr:DUF2637 domain-containing protein [Kitasatospora sp. NBC_00240]MCX5216183.1 hypothetical protein [Kitasatospora sp. NBC_00240]
MTLDLAPRPGPILELLTSWQFVLGAVVMTLGPTLVLRRHRALLAARHPQHRAAEADQRGRRIEDRLTLVIAAAAAALSANGLRRVGRHQMGLNDPFDLLPFIALDVAAMVCGRRARRRAREGAGPGLSGILFWVLAGISAVFSAAEADSLLGAAVRAVWPVLAAVLWEIGSLEERRAARANRGRTDRRLALVRLFHPVEALRVAMLLAARQDLPEDEATTEVRISRAAYRWYRLRRAQEMVKKAGRLTRWAYRMREAYADSRAQAASERAGCADPDVLERVVGRLQLRVRQSEWAGMNLRNAASFEAVLATLIGTGNAVPGHTDPGHTDTASTHTSQVTTGMGTAGHDGQEAPGTDDATGHGPKQVLSDEEVMKRFLARVPRKPDGTFAWGYNKAAAKLGIGTGRSRKFLDSQAEWLPQALQLYDGPMPNEADQIDTEADNLDEHFAQALAVANTSARPTPPTVERRLLPVTPAELLELAVPKSFSLHQDTGLLVPTVNGAGRS